MAESFQNIEERYVDYVDVSDEEMSVGNSVEAEDELNISWTSSEADDTDISSSNKDTEEVIFPTTISAEDKKKWFKQPQEHVRIVDKFVDIQADKRQLKYPIVSWEYDASRNIFIIKRQRGFPQFIERIDKFKSLP